MSLYENGTNLESEELGYPSGAIMAGRRARARCEDGVIRTIRIGIPDTFFSIPGRTQVRGKTVKGFVHVEEEEIRFCSGGKNRLSAGRP